MGLRGQVNNLVPNGDFEYYTGCPDGMAQIDSAYPWTQPLNQSTSDYYNTCNNDWNSLFFIMHKPLSGNGMAGIGSNGYLINNNSVIEYREYISNKLKNKLIINNNYCAKFYAKHFGCCWYITNSLGLYFSI